MSPPTTNHEIEHNLIQALNHTLHNLEACRYEYCRVIDHPYFPNEQLTTMTNNLKSRENQILEYL